MSGHLRPVAAGCVTWAVGMGLRAMWQGLVAAIVAIAATRSGLAASTQPVEAKAVVSAAHVQAGTPFDVGVLLRMQPGWHVYWLNPGDAGLPTTVRWTAPEGFSVGPLRWPVPRRFEQPGRGVGYGYAATVLLRARVAPPAAVAGGPVPVQAGE